MSDNEDISFDEAENRHTSTGLAFWSVRLLELFATKRTRHLSLTDATQELGVKDKKRLQEVSNILHQVEMVKRNDDSISLIGKLSQISEDNFFDNIAGSGQLLEQEVQRNKKKNQKSQHSLGFYTWKLMKYFVDHQIKEVNLDLAAKEMKLKAKLKRLREVRDVLDAVGILKKKVDGHDDDVIAIIATIVELPEDGDSDHEEEDENEEAPVGEGASGHEEDGANVVEGASGYEEENADVVVERVVVEKDVEKAVVEEAVVEKAPELGNKDKGTASSSSEKSYAVLTRELMDLFSTSGELDLISAASTLGVDKEKLFDLIDILVQVRVWGVDIFGRVENTLRIIPKVVHEELISLDDLEDVSMLLEEFGVDKVVHGIQRPD